MNSNSAGSFTVSGKTLLGLVAVVLVLGCFLRLPPIWGHPLHFDEPFWMVRGEWLISRFVSGAWGAPQEDLWNIRTVTPEGPLYYTNISTGVPTALITGLGQRVLPAGKRTTAGDIPRVRLLHSLIAASTPALFVLLAATARLPTAGLLSFALFLLLTPQLRNYTSIAHLESVLTLTVFGSVLFFEAGWIRRSWLWIIFAGITYGIAFATRVSAAAAFLTVGLFYLAAAGSRMFLGHRNRKSLPLMQVFCFGLVGWSVFVLLFPPVWRDPLFGFLGFLRQYAGAPGGSSIQGVLSGIFAPSWIQINEVFTLLALIGWLLPQVRGHRLFLLAWMFCIVSVLMLSQGTTPSAPRYLSSVVPGLGLAGSVTVWQLWLKIGLRRWERPICMSMLAGMLFFGGLAAGREKRRAEQIFDFYQPLRQQQFSQIDVWPISLGLRRESSGTETSKLHLLTPAWHVSLVYLGVGLSDLREKHYWNEGWTARLIEKGGLGCQEGEWLLSEDAQAPNNLTHRRQLYTLVSGRCP